MVSSFNDELVTYFDDTLDGVSNSVGNWDVKRKSALNTE